MPKLGRHFFQQPTLLLAKELIGCRFVRVLGTKTLAAIIVETEAYLSQKDPACHAAIGETKRNRTMFGPSGRLYVYSIHNRYCMNIVSENVGEGAAVLIRAIEPIQGIEAMTELRPVAKITELTNGPGKLCQALGIDIQHNGVDLMESDTIWLEPKTEIVEFEIRTTSRIGISQGKDFPYRFFVDRNPFVSGRAGDHSSKRNTNCWIATQKDCNR
jgi:DNA-3-methyladenine glycosylase